MIIHLLLLAIFLLLTPPVYAEDAIDRYTPSAYCHKDEGEWSCMERIEWAWLKGIANKAKRVEDQLILRLQNGLSIIRKNSPKDVTGAWESKGKPNAQYQLHGYVEKAALYVLRVRYWEDSGYEFISEKDGSSVNINGCNPPIFSPDRSMFFVDESSPYWDNVETTEWQIWSVTPGEISKKWSHTTKKRLPVVASWISNNEIRLYEEKKEYGSARGRLTSGRRLAVVRFSKGRWTLVEEGKGKSRNVK